MCFIYTIVATQNPDFRISRKMGRRQVEQGFPSFLPKIWHIGWFFKVLQYLVHSTLQNHPIWQKFGKKWKETSSIPTFLYITASNQKPGSDTCSTTSTHRQWFIMDYKNASEFLVWFFKWQLHFLNKKNRSLYYIWHLKIMIEILSILRRNLLKSNLGAFMLNQAYSVICVIGV